MHHSSLSTQHSPLPRRWRRGALAALLAAGGAVALALAGDGRGGPLTAGVEGIVQGVGTLLAAVAGALPVGYAFGAGMVAAVNPCGIALLPAFLSLYLGAGEAGGPPGRWWRVRRALAVGAAVTAGFILLFGLAGLLVSLATGLLVQALPWAGLAVGGLLVLAGGWLLAGGGLAAGLAERVADRLGASAQRPGGRGFLVYGVVYGLASLGCTLPIFLTVVGSTFAVRGVLAAAVQYLLYALGMGLVLTLLTLSAAVVEAATLARARRLSRYVPPVSAGLVLLAGAYLIYYWLTLGGLLAGIRNA